MPRLKRKSYEMIKRDNKLRKRKKMEEEKKHFQTLVELINYADDNDEPSVPQINKTNELRDDPAKTRVAKHAEYVRNYRKNMSEERKKVARAEAAWRMAQRRKNMTEEEKLAQREYHRKRMAFKRQRMTDEQKIAAREADRQRMALKRKKWKEEPEHFQATMVRLAVQRQNFLPQPLDLTVSTSDDDDPQDIQRFLSITLITGQSITSN